MKNNECVYICEQFTDYKENSLSPDIRAEVDQHLDTCSPCNVVFQELERVLTTLQELPPINAQDNFTTNLMSRISDEAQATTWHKLSRSPYMRAAGYAVAAGLIVALTLNVWLDPVQLANPNGSRDFVEEQKTLPKAERALVSHIDSSKADLSDTLSLHHNTINAGTSTLQLVSGKK